MRRAVFAAALAGATMTACAVLAGLGENYASPDAAASANDTSSGDSASGDSGREGSPVDAPSIDDAQYLVDAADAIAPVCGDFSCPGGGAFCDQFDAGLGNWTPFSGTLNAHVDDSDGCDKPSLAATSTADDDEGVQRDFNNAPNKLTLQVDLRIDTLGPSDEGDFFKIFIASYDLRAHYKDGKMYVLEVDNGVMPSAHSPAWDVAAGTSWLRVVLELDRKEKKCTLAVNAKVVSDDEDLLLTPPASGAMTVGLSPRKHDTSGPVAIHLDNVLVTVE
jgi:hypothetical protein